MADNTEVATGVGAATRTWSSKDLGGSVHVHRALLASLSAGGVLLDASPTTPVPVTGTVDTELPTAAVPGDTDGNTAAPVVIARPQTYSAAGWRMLRSSTGSALSAVDPVAAGMHLHDPVAAQARPVRTANALTDTEGGQHLAGAGNMVHDHDAAQWLRATVARADGTGVPTSRRPPAVMAQLRHDADNTLRQPRTAASVGDAEAGTTFGAVASVLWDGAAWQRARSHQAQVVSLALAARAALTAYPAIVTRGARGLLMILHVEAAPATGNLGLYIKASGNNATLAGATCPASLFAGASPAAPRTAGILVMPGSTVNNATASSMPTVAAAFSVVGVPVSPTHTMTGYVQPSSSDSWTYSLSHWLVA